MKKRDYILPAIKYVCEVSPLLLESVSEGVIGGGTGSDIDYGGVDVGGDGTPQAKTFEMRNVWEN